jgi:hypothetical protein
MSCRSLASLSTTLLILAGAVAVAGTAHAEDWRKIDFDADLTTYLVDIDRIEHNGDNASVHELNVPGRTSIATGGQSHTLLERRFDCTKGTETLGDIFHYRTLTDRGQQLAHPDITFPVRRRSLDEIMFNMACHGAAPPNPSGYPSIEQAVHRAFMDAIKLPADQSVRTRRPFEPPGEPLMGPADAPPPR